MDLTVIVLFVLGLVALVGGAELLVRGSSLLAVSLGITPLVVGLTIVAFGTSAPELAVSVQSAYQNQPSISIGNVVGSNICNVLFILGVSAIITPLVVAQQLVRFDVPLMIGASCLLLIVAFDGSISRIDGIVLFVIIVTYTVWLLRQSRKETKAIQEQYEEEFGEEATGWQAHWAAQTTMIVVGLALLLLGSDWFVQGATTFARAFGVSELVIGLTIVALGTSLPEAATSIVAAFKGERDIAVGNVVGSNIFNILSVLGIASIAAPDGIAVPPAALSFDIPVMIAVAVACLPIFFIGYRIERWEGLVFFGYYIAYLLYLVLAATDHDALPAFSKVMLLFAIPLTVLTIGVTLMRSLRHRKETSSG